MEINSMHEVWDNCELVLIVKVSVEIPCEATYHDLEDFDLRIAVRSWETNSITYDI
jgi:hypothetical protein